MKRIIIRLFLLIPLLLYMAVLTFVGLILCIAVGVDNVGSVLLENKATKFFEKHFEIS